MRRFVPAVLAVAAFSPLYAQVAAPAPPPSLTAPAAAPAPVPVTPAKRAKIEKLMSLLTVDTQLQSMMKAQSDRIHSIGEQRMAQAQNDAQKKLTTDYIAQMDSLTRDSLVWDKTKEVVIQTYADQFSDADLDASITFFSSPAGQDFITKSPTINNKVGEYTQNVMKTLVPQLQDATKTYNDKMKAAAPVSLQPLDPPHAPPAASTPAPAPAPKQ